jgi:hypothetical protein
MAMEPIDHIAAGLQTLSSLLDEAASIDGLAPLDLADERALLDELRAQQDRLLRVAVIGEFSTGKSTFINAILCQDLLPARFLPTTRQVISIRHCEGLGQVGVVAEEVPDFAAVDDAGDASPAPWSEPPAQVPLSPQAVLDLASTGLPLAIEMPIPAPWSDFDIYDTPGVNDATAMTEAVIFDLMDRVDVVVLMLRAQQALSASEADFLGHLVRHKDLDKFFFDINFCDSLAADQVASVRAHVVHTLGELRNWPIKALGERVFLCSAQRTLDVALGKADPAATDHPNEHASLLAAVHAYASARKQALLHEAADGLLRTVAESAASKLSAAMDAADNEDASQGQPLIEITRAVTDLRVAIREEELALRERISDRKATLLRDVTDAFADIERTMQDWVSTANLDELAGDGGKRLRVAVEEGLAPLLSAFRADLDGVFADFDQRILPDMARTSERVDRIRQGLDLGPVLAGTGIATAGYLVVSAALPWVLGATGALAVTAGLASLIPGVGGTVGALVGAGLGAAATSVPRMLMGIASSTASGYRWLRDTTRNWQAQRTRDAYAKQVATLVAGLRREIMGRLNEAIDPAQIIDGALTGRFPEALMLEERRLLTARLDRDRLRDARQCLKQLRAQFIAAIPPLRTPHD